MSTEEGASGMPAVPHAAADGVRLERDLRLRSGRVRVHCWGRTEDAQQLVICIPGLSSNACSFDWLAAGLCSSDRCVVAVDLRGRGRSEVTPRGTYGWPAHASDVAEIAEQLGVSSIDLLGHSMGAYVAMQLAGDRPDLVDRTVLIDGAGAPEPAAVRPICAGLGRLEGWHGSEEAYVEAVRSAGVVAPWNELWDRFYRYELTRAPGGQVRALTSRSAALEDLEYGRQNRHEALWERLRGPVLLLRATVPLGDGGGFVVTGEDAQRFPQEVPGSKVVSIEANHFGVLGHPGTQEAIAGFLGDRREEGAAQ